MEYAVGSDTFKRKRVSTLFKVEVIRLVVKTFLILNGVLNPTIIGYLTGSKIVVLAVTGNLSLILPVTVERKILCSCERIISVDFKSDIQYGILCFVALDRIVDSLEVVKTSLFDIELICKCELIILPFYCGVMICLEIGAFCEKCLESVVAVARLLLDLFD
jgi:hypothetical protein